MDAFYPKLHIYNLFHIFYAIFDVFQYHDIMLPNIIYLYHSHLNTYLILLFQLELKYRKIDLHEVVHVFLN